MTVNDEEFKQIVKNSNNISDVCRKLDISIHQGNYITIKRRIKLLNIDTSHFNRNIQNKRFNRSKPLQEILIQHSLYASSYHLKKRLIKENILKNECSICGQQPFWNGKSMIMILDHINGEHTDNRLENLRLVCPNCNSQLDTSNGKNVKDRKFYFCIKCGKQLREKRLSGMCLLCLKQQRHENALINSKLKKERKLKQQNVKPKQKSVLNILLEKYTFDQIKQMIENNGYKNFGKQFNVTGSCVKSWCERNNLTIDPIILKEKHRENFINNVKQFLEQRKIVSNNKQICQCGNKKKSTAKMCRECWLKMYKRV